MSKKTFIPDRISAEREIRMIKKYMCSTCTFYKDGVCSLKRNVRYCRKNRLKNKQ